MAGIVGILVQHFPRLVHQLFIDAVNPGGFDSRSEGQSAKREPATNASSRSNPLGGVVAIIDPRAAERCSFSCTWSNSSVLIIPQFERWIISSHPELKRGIASEFTV